jgi:hypothetical protein
VVKFTDLPSKEVIVPDVFDPTISPHAYAGGTPDVIVGDNATSATNGVTKSNARIGIL